MRTSSNYSDQTELLMDILPWVSEEPDFALKGGTAINMFGTTTIVVDKVPAPRRKRGWRI